MSGGGLQMNYKISIINKKADYLHYQVRGRIEYALNQLNKNFNFKDYWVNYEDGRYIVYIIADNNTKEHNIQDLVKELINIADYAGIDLELQRINYLSDSEISDQENKEDPHFWDKKEIDDVFNNFEKTGKTLTVLIIALIAFDIVDSVTDIFN
jgi:hypothetical protein